MEIFKPKRSKNSYRFLEKNQKKVYKQLNLCYTNIEILIIL